MLKKIIVNILLVTFLLAIFEICSYFLVCLGIGYGKMHFLENFHSQSFLKNYNSVPYYQDYITFNDFFKGNLDNEGKFKHFRKPQGLNYNKRPIILFGCSFTYGDQLKDTQTFGFKLSNATNRPVYNYAKGGWGLQHMLYLLNEDKTLDQIKNPEYIIFTLIADHFPRLNSPTFYPDDSIMYLNYKKDEKNNTLVSNANSVPFLYRFYLPRLTSRLWANYVGNSKKNQYFNKNFDFMKQILIESKKEAEKKYPGVKFALLIYPNEFQNKSRWKELEEKDIILIDADKYLDTQIKYPEYCLPDGHPNEKAWDKITPLVQKKLNL